MVSWKKVLAHRLVKIEDSYDMLKYRLRERLGGRDPIMILPYRGFGTREKVFIKGRVLENKNIQSAMDDDTLWEHLLNMYKRFESDEIPYARVMVSMNGIEEEVVTDEEGFFETGDVATIDVHGYMHITDRAKDVIKSGGEWISSIELENLAVGHPDVAEAAVIGVRHPKWDERPLLIVVAKPGRTVDPAALIGFLEGKVAKWWLPDDVVTVDEIPHTATGKILKAALRERFADHRLPTA